MRKGRMRLSERTLVRSGHERMSEGCIDRARNHAPFAQPPLTRTGLFGGCRATAEHDSHEGKRRVESQWPIFKLHHQRSRYVYDIYYKRHAISKELYEFLLEQGYADGQLIAKWKKVRHRASSHRLFAFNSYLTQQTLKRALNSVFSRLARV